MNFTVKNGYKISALTLGTVQLGLAYGVNNDKGMPSFEESSAILDTALAAGILSFDTARGYGESELVLKRYFAEKDVEKTIISKAFSMTWTRAACATDFLRWSASRSSASALPSSPF